jgi:starch phosphorylase
VLDGWWREAYNGSNGWSIGEDSSEPDLEAQDEKDFEDLFRTLTELVIPEFYTRNERGIPERWIKRIRNAMRSLIPMYNTERMVAEYVENFYIAK